MISPLFFVYTGRWSFLCGGQCHCTSKPAPLQTKPPVLGTDCVAGQTTVTMVLRNTTTGVKAGQTYWEAISCSSNLMIWCGWCVTLWPWLVSSVSSCTLQHQLLLSSWGKVSSMQTDSELTFPKEVAISPQDSFQTWAGVAQTMYKINHKNFHLHMRKNFFPLRVQSPGTGCTGRA